MQFGFSSKNEAIEVFRNNLFNALTYFEKFGNMSAEELKNRCDEYQNKCDKLELKMTSEIKIRNVRKISSALYTALDVCNLLGLENTNKLTNDILSDKSLSKIIDLECDWEKEHNKTSENKSYIFSQLYKDNSKTM